MITIAPYQSQYQKGIDGMMLEIAGEFEETIYSPISKSIRELSSNPDEQYWVALHDSKVIGTVGVVVINSNIGILKRMMLHKKYRGKTHNMAHLLLQTVIDWCNEKQITELYLGTMQQFIAAQRFYEKKGFTNIPGSKLPHNMPLNPVDTVFYHLHLENMNAEHA